MSRPRFLADHDLNAHVIDGVLRREPTIDIYRVRDFGLQSRPDPEVLAFATERGLIVISHDVNTMPAHATARMANGTDISGLLMVRQSLAIHIAIDSILLVWAASEAEEWKNRIGFLPF
jgi:hypothetical protein